MTVNKSDGLLKGTYYDVSIRPTDITPPGTTRYRPADYRLWLPNTVAIRGLIVKQHGCGDSAAETGLEHASDLQWQALALKHQFALLGARRPTLEFCDGVIDRGADDVLLEALRLLAQKSHHPELEQVPWALWGHSGGADWSMYMLQKYPDRTLAVVAMRSGGILLFDGSEFLTRDIKADILSIPVLFALGENDPYVEEALELPKKVFSRYRNAGALWAIAVEANTGHETADTRLLAIPYLDTILAARLTAHDTKLHRIDASKGWLGNPTTHVVAPMNQYEGEPLEAAWLPDEATARKWQAYVDTGIWNRGKSMLCRGEKLFTRLGIPRFIEGCHTSKISPTQKPLAPTDVQIIRISATEVILTWNFVPDLENGLPSFRIYRNNSLLKTLQGQGHNFGDAPEPSHVVLEFRDQKATANTIYTVSAFNVLGESVSPPTQVVEKS